MQKYSMEPEGLEDMEMKPVYEGSNEPHYYLCSDVDKALREVEVKARIGSDRVKIWRDMMRAQIVADKYIPSKMTKAIAETILFLAEDLLDARDALHVEDAGVKG